MAAKPIVNSLRNKIQAGGFLGGENPFGPSRLSRNSASLEVRPAWRLVWNFSSSSASVNKCSLMFTSLAKSRSFCKKKIGKGSFYLKLLTFPTSGGSASLEQHSNDWNDNLNFSFPGTTGISSAGGCSLFSMMIATCCVLQQMLLFKSPFTSRDRQSIASNCTGPSLIFNKYCF